MSKTNNSTDRKDGGSLRTFKSGAVAFVFLVIGYETALFVHHTAVLKIQESQDKPDTVFVVRHENGNKTQTESKSAQFQEPAFLTIERHNATHPPAVQAVRKHTRKVESFPFNPNTASVEDLQRLGFSEKQAASIDKYRKSGGRFRRRSDFKKSFVVSDSIYRRLEKYIDIPLLDINEADSAAFDALPGIGAYLAAKIVSYRNSLGGYSFCEQLMDIYRLDSLKYDALKDLICCSPPSEGFNLWTLDEEGLRNHPYIRTQRVAHNIVLFRNSTPKRQWSVEALVRAGILDRENGEKLNKCKIKTGGTFDDAS